MKRTGSSVTAPWVTTSNVAILTLRAKADNSSGTLVQMDESTVVSPVYGGSDSGENVLKALYPATVFIGSSQNVDTVAPEIMIDTLEDGQVVKRNRRMKIKGLATDNIAVTSVEIYADNELVCLQTEPSFSCRWRVPNIKKHTFTIEAKAYDEAGNVGIQTLQVSTVK